MIVLRTPKGWTGPKEVDGLPVEGTWRSHQVPLADVARRTPSTCAQLEEWLRSYRPEELFDERRARSSRSSPSCRPTGERRMSANPHANGGLLLRDLVLPDFRDYAVEVERPGHDVERGDARARRASSRDVDRARTRENFRLFGPDETASNRLGDVFEVDRPRRGRPRSLPTDEHLAPDGPRASRCSPSTCARAGSRATC